MTTVTTTPAPTTEIAATTTGPNNNDILATPDFAYLSWAFTSLDFMTNTEDQRALELVKLAGSLDVEMDKRVMALEELTVAILKDVKAQPGMIMGDSIHKITLTLFDLLLDPEPDVQLDAFSTLIHLTILKRKHDDPGFVKLLREREARFQGDCRMPLNALDLALVFEMAMNVFSDQRETELESFFQAFREYTASGRHLILRTA